MRDPAELLTLLTARGVQVTYVPGGVPELTAQDVAAMMRGLTECEELMVRTKYMAEPRHALWARYFTELMRQGWDAGRGQIDTFSQLTLDEHVSPTHCRACNGNGESLNSEGRLQECQSCQGRGTRYLTNHHIAKRLGYADKLPQIWKYRLAFARRELQRCELRALSKIAAG